jgi:hypothetical protein
MFSKSDSIRQYELIKMFYFSGKQLQNILPFRIGQVKRSYLNQEASYPDWGFS